MFGKGYLDLQENDESVQLLTDINQTVYSKSKP